MILCVCVYWVVYTRQAGKIAEKGQISLVVGGFCQLPYNATTMASVQASLDTVPADSLKTGLAHVYCIHRLNLFLFYSTRGYISSRNLADHQGSTQTVRY